MITPGDQLGGKRKLTLDTSVLDFISTSMSWFLLHVIFFKKMAQRLRKANFTFLSAKALWAEPYQNST